VARECIEVDAYRQWNAASGRQAWHRREGCLRLALAAQDEMSGSSNTLRCARTVCRVASRL